MRGTKKVKGNPTSRSHHDGYDGESVTGFIRGVSHPGNQHADQDGMEVVEDWECGPGYPVRLLGEQSGISKSTGGVNEGKLGKRIYGKFKNETIGANAGGLGDEGSASRFFKQIGEHDG
jgi:hypothetical protein